jgi:signal transduction histidine kinase
VDATEVANLLRQSSLDALLADIVRSAGDVAFIVFEDAEVTKTAGEVPGAAGSSDARILEITGPIDVGGPHPALLRVGMRLDRLRLAERRTLGRLALTVVTAAALGVLALGLVGAGRRFGALSAEHALAQEALRRKDRLAAMGELSSTVAHEIRNPLNAIAMSAQRLERECLGRGGGADGDDARELVSVIKREAQRMNGKVQQFLEYARPPSLNRQPIEIGPWLSGVIAAVHPVADERHVRLLLDTRSSAVALIDGDQMRQALDNLLLNAIDATPQGGTVSVRAVVADGLAIEVHDTGAGIPAEVLPKIFDLYFTTKPGGTGVGLAVTQQIVAAHGGTVEVDGAGGRGTTMRIRVPLQEEAARG